MPCSESTPAPPAHDGTTGLGGVPADAHLAAMDEDIRYLALIDDDDILIDVAALQLAALDHPEADLDDYLELLATLSEQVAEHGGDALSAAGRAGMLADVIAGRAGFAGDRDTYDDPANADMIRVIERRRGLPVSLSILYVALARRQGWLAHALNTPGHVLVRVGGAPDAVLIDPFNRGAPVEPARLAALLVHALGEDGTVRPEHLAPMENRAVLVRLLLNEATRAEKRGDPTRALTLYERMTVVAPASGHAWWERARLELVLDDAAAARASLSAMLEMTRDATARTHILAALDGLSARER